jgi:hypothetical protein
MIAGLEWSNCVRLMDFDGDNDLDALVTGDVNFTSYKIALCDNQGGGSFSTVNLEQSDEIIYRKGGMADFNNDGRNDIAVCGAEGNGVVRWYRNTGSGFSSYITVDSLTITSAFESIAVGLINDDEYPDIVAGTSYGRELIWYRNTGTGTFSENTISSLYNVYDIEIVDFDGDGDNDIVVSQHNGNTIRCWANSGGSNPSFSPQLIGYMYTPIGIAIGDVDQDDSLDVVAASISGDSIIWFRRRTVGFEKIVVDTFLDGASFVEIADVDQDNQPEIVATGRDANEVVYYDVSPVAIEEKKGSKEVFSISSRVKEGCVTISLMLDTPSCVKVSVYDITGKEVAEIFNGYIEKRGKWEWSPSSSGVYFIKGTSLQNSKVNKVIVVL